ncbi:MAG TPA: DUF3368 domain-containing protein [Phycisphaerae bacterium]|nr:DUF3368 domain-containing protein [Phycisphaerae bacterium]
MIVIADSSPLIVLVNIQCVDLLPLLFKRILIPPAVARELLHPRRPSAVRNYFQTPPSWLQVQSPTLHRVFPFLHAGETEALNLVVELHANAILVDERKATQAAAALNVEVIGTIGILERAARQGAVNLQDAFDKLKQTDFWISHALLDQRLALFRAKQSPPS